MKFRVPDGGGFRAFADSAWGRACVLVVVLNLLWIGLTLSNYWDEVDEEGYIVFFGLLGAALPTLFLVGHIFLKGNAQIGWWWFLIIFAVTSVVVLGFLGEDDDYAMLAFAPFVTLAYALLIYDLGHILQKVFRVLRVVAIIAVAGAVVVAGVSIYTYVREKQLLADSSPSTEEPGQTESTLTEQSAHDHDADYNINIFGDYEQVSDDAVSAPLFAELKTQPSDETFENCFSSLNTAIKIIDNERPALSSDLAKVLIGSYLYNFGLSLSKDEYAKIDALEDTPAKAVLDLSHLRSCRSIVAEAGWVVLLEEALAGESAEDALRSLEQCATAAFIISHQLGRRQETNLRDQLANNKDVSVRSQTEAKARRQRREEIEEIIERARAAQSQRTRTHFETLKDVLPDEETKVQQLSRQTALDPEAVWEDIGFQVGASVKALQYLYKDLETSVAAETIDQIFLEANKSAIQYVSSPGSGTDELSSLGQSCAKVGIDFSKYTATP